MGRRDVPAPPAGSGITRRSWLGLPMRARLVPVAAVSPLAAAAPSPRERIQARHLPNVALRTQTNRAVRFYETVLEATLARETMGPTQMAVFPHEKPAPSGAVAHGPAFTPGPQGTIVYLNVDDLTPVLRRIPGAGGSVRLPRTALPEGMGFFAQFEDSEGNVVGLFSPR